MKFKASPSLKRDARSVIWFRAIGLQRYAHKTLAFCLVVPLAIAPLLLQSCGFLDYDHRGKIAHATLYDEKGVLDERALSAALVARFANTNSPPASLDAFVESLGGKCNLRPEQEISMYCSIPQSGTLCVARVIQLFVVVSNGVIADLSAKTHLDGC